MNANQCANIIVHLRDKGPLRPLQALELYGCFRLGARIWDLKQRGEPIEKRMVSVGNGKRVAEYYLSKGESK